MRYTLIISLLILAINSIAQERKTYSFYVNKAELKIIESEYKTALNFYDSAFVTAKKVPFAQDYYNALICCVNIDCSEKAFHYLEKLTLKGIPIAEFRDNVYLKPLQENEKWKDLENFYSEKKDSIQASFNSLLKNKFDQMVDEEQAEVVKARQNNNDFSAYKAKVKENSILFQRIIKEYGFPTEEIIGIRAPQKPYLRRSLLIHQFKILEDNSNTWAILKEAFKEEELKQNSFFGIVATALHGDDDPYASKVFYVVDTTIVDINYTDAFIERANEKRYELGLPSFEDSYKKAHFHVKNTLKWAPKEKNETNHSYFERLEQLQSQTPHFIIGQGLFIQVISTDSKNRKYLIENIGK